MVLLKLYNHQPLLLLHRLSFKSKGSDTPSVIAAGLPNIIGNGPRVDNYVATTGASGAFYVTQVYGTRRASSSTNENCPRYDFNANLSNSIYGAATTVQPPTITLIPQIKF